MWTKIGPIELTGVQELHPDIIVTREAMDTIGELQDHPLLTVEAACPVEQVGP